MMEKLVRSVSKMLTVYFTYAEITNVALVIRLVQQVFLIVFVLVTELVHTAVGLVNICPNVQ